VTSGGGAGNGRRSTASVARLGVLLVMAMFVLVVEPMT
jgi:hypothetical protein